MGRGDARKSTVNYDKLRDGKVVYKRKTNDPEKKAKEPTHQGKRFTLPTTDFEVCRMTSKKKKPETVFSDGFYRFRHRARMIYKKKKPETGTGT